MGNSLRKTICYNLNNNFVLSDEAELVKTC